MRTNFYDCLELIKNEEIRNFVDAALCKAPKKFWTAPCSSSGKYHPPENQVRGGIVVHSRKMVQVAVSLFRFFGVENQATKDKILAAVILHDIQKGGIPWSGFDKKHGKIAADWLYNEVCTSTQRKNRDIKDILEFVENHMGRWAAPKKHIALTKGGRLCNRDICNLIVQLCDYFASRKWCPFVCDSILSA